MSQDTFGTQERNPISTQVNDPLGIIRVEFDEAVAMIQSQST